MKKLLLAALLISPVACETGVVRESSLGARGGALATSEETVQVVEVTEGETVSISLPATAGTGYAWRCVGGLGDLLAQEGEPEFRADSTRLGSSGVQVLTFRALRVGRTRLDLAYGRSWEETAVRRCSIDIKVR